MTDPFADAADYFGDDAAPTPPLSPRPALFPAPSAEEVAEAKARKEAAAAPPESSPPPPPARKRPKQRGLRVGAWSDEEVAYAERVSDLYRQGKLPNCPDGTTLRSLLATLLNCQPMRISKKCSVVWKSKFYGAFVLNRRVVLHAIDATAARWRADAGSSPFDRVRTATSSPRNDLVKNCHPIRWLISTQVWAGVAEVSADVLRRLPPGRLRLCANKISGDSRPSTRRFHAGYRVGIFTGDRRADTQSNRPDGADVCRSQSFHGRLEAVVLGHAPTAEGVGFLRRVDCFRRDGDARREWLLGEHILACLKRGDHHRGLGRYG